MSVRKAAVHQFTPAVSVGDGVSNGVFFTQTLLRALGFESEVFAFTIPDALQHAVHFVDACPDEADQVLLVHHALGHEFGDWIAQRRARKVLVYHNITPAHFFAPAHPVHRLSLLGREMLAEWQAGGVFEACIGDSEYNSAELVALGFDPVWTVPLLVDAQACRTRPWDASVAARHADRFSLLFVGRLAPHKCQHELLRVMEALLPHMNRPVELLLVGESASAEYEARLRADIVARGLSGYAHLLGKVDEASLYALYRSADVFVCMSEHEGFGMPLIEAMLFDVPVLAVDFGSVAATMGCGGLVFSQDRSPQAVAATIACLANDAALREQVVAGQRARVARFSRERLNEDLLACLAQLGVHPAGA